MTKPKKTTPAKGTASKKAGKTTPKSVEKDVAPKKQFNEDEEDEDNMDLDMDDMDVDYDKDVAFDDDDDDDDF